MQIKVIGWPCTKTQRTLLNAQAAAAEFDVKPKVHWIDDIHKIAGMGGLAIPTIMVNEKVKVAGRIPSVHEFKMWIEQEQKEEIAA